MVLRNIEKGKKHDEQSYSEPFTNRELKSAKKNNKKTEPEEDIMHPQTIIRILTEIMKYISYMYNMIWKKGKRENLQKKLGTTYP